MQTAVPLLGGNYTSRSLIAGAQRCVNLYAEANQKDAPFPYTNYSRPGLRFEGGVPVPVIVAGSRCMYRSSTGSLFEVIDDKVYVTTFVGVRNLLGTINSGLGLVSMQDNGTVIVIVDGSATGWVVNLGTLAFSTIVDPAFYGANRVAYLDGFLIFNRPNTTQVYLSPLFWDGVAPFDALDIADKIGTPDTIRSLVVNSAQLWLIGDEGTEVWYNAAAADFPLQRVPGILIQNGTNAPDSVTQTDTGVFWLSQNEQGEAIFLMGSGYEVKPVSTRAIEAVWQRYPDIRDASSFSYQLDGHTFVQINFPQGDATWTYDVGENLWHEQTWIDTDGIEHRHRASCAANAYGKVYAGDWETGTLMSMDLDYFQDINSPIVCRRGFRHLTKGARGVAYQKLVLSADPGQAVGLLSTDKPPVYLRWSDTQGFSWSDPVAGSPGSTGEYSEWATWWQLGIARDRVFEIFWSLPSRVTLMGAYVDFEVADS
jgi:hypothetical protein